MQSRYNLLVAKNGRTTQRLVRRGARSRRLLTTTQNARSSSLLVSYYPGHMRIDRGSCNSNDYRYFHSSRIVLEPRSLHTSSPLSGQAISTSLHDDNNDEDEYVSRIANSHLSELLKDDNVLYEEDINDSWPSLDDELGENSIWDAAPEEDQDAARKLQRRSQQAPKRSAHDMLVQFDPQCPPQSDKLEDLQLWLECEAQRESVLKYQNVIDDARERGDYASLSIVQQQILRWYPTLLKAIQAEQEAYMTKSKTKKDMNRYGPFLCTLQPQKLAVIVAHESIMHSLQKGVNGVTLVTLALKIGAAVEAEVNVQRALQKGMQEYAQRAKKELGEEELGEEDEEALWNGNVAAQATDSESLMETPSSDESNDDDDSVQHFDNWMYGPSHLQRFIEANSLEPSKKTRIRISYANRRARRILNSDDEWRKPEKVKLGTALIEALLENATVVHNGKEEKAFLYEKRYLAKDKFVGRIYLHDQLYKMVAEDSYESLEANTTRYKPMVLPPRDWVAPDDGGYSWLKTDLMRTHGSKLQKV